MNENDCWFILSQCAEFSFEITRFSSLYCTNLSMIFQTDSEHVTASKWDKDKNAPVPEPINRRQMDDYGMYWYPISYRYRNMNYDQLILQMMMMTMQMHLRLKISKVNLKISTKNLSLHRQNLTLILLSKRKSSKHVSRL
jgi:hypothetical protein